MQKCPGGTGCDICPDGPVVADTLEVSRTDPDGTTITAPCGEWFDIGCALEDLSNCAQFQNDLIQCCTVIAATRQANGSPSAVPTIVSSQVPTIVSSQVPTIIVSTTNVPSSGPSVNAPYNILKRPPHQ